MIEILDMSFLHDLTFEMPLSFYTPFMIVLASGLISWLGRVDYLAMEWAKKRSL